MIHAAVIGAGSRGMFDLGSYALKRPNEIKFVAVAEPNEERRRKFAEMYGIAPELQFGSWEQLLAQPKLCEALLICTMDKGHFRPTMKALEAGYHILLEKPMSPDPKEALLMAEEAKRRDRILTICHSMRYSGFFRAVKQLLDQGAIGRMMTIQWIENVGYWHQAHSFVRGNWRNTAESSPMLLQKCCHDLDYLNWIVGASCTSVSSFGSLSHFREENAPEGSTDRCTDGCKVEHECPYSALKWYLNEKDAWPQKVVSLEPTLDARLKALREGPYGRCVYRCDNDVVDHQVVTLQFDNDVTVAFTMTAFTRETSRSFKIMGTKAELIGHTEQNEIEIRHFSGRTEIIRPEEQEGGHSGADTLLMQSFVRQVETQSEGVSNGMESARSHLLVFAAEQSRLTGETVHFDRYVDRLRTEYAQAAEAVQEV
ncbi:Gfo/Idh/MocA family oxidoreductase [Paenibacillus lycopersici]|uniref:Gfo/Idh/MocA family oxidoreductase n=1 Tax=Paenibacillus lycopersici TaxID=2704462 RepID=A0A6C0G6N0_9BACL|nr:Gfo/Idh/MocA family oxidoreductase [Paenibacillus lycopersici]QHT61435.1 Gfo/Idh/MocA family oxidoreductase [Paenibacillus lycopersici]